MINKIQPNISFSALKYQNPETYNNMDKLMNDDKITYSLYRGINSINKITGDVDVFLIADEKSGQKVKTPHYTFSIYNKYGRILTSSYAPKADDVPSCLIAMANDLKKKLSDNDEEMILAKYSNIDNDTNGLRITDECSKENLKELMVSNLSMACLSLGLKELDNKSKMKKVFLTVKTAIKSNKKRYTLSLEDKDGNEFVSYSLKAPKLSYKNKLNKSDYSQSVTEAFAFLNKGLEEDNINDFRKVLNKYLPPQENHALKIKDDYVREELINITGGSHKTVQIAQEGLEELNKSAGDNDIYLSIEYSQTNNPANRKKLIVLRDNKSKDIIATNYAEGLQEKQILKAVFKSLNEKLEKYVNSQNNQ